MRHVAVVGAGPAGLIAAETLATAGRNVTVYERMARPARKFLLAGRGGLNLTHSEPLDRFLARYGAAEARLTPAIRAFPPEALCAWAAGLGEDTFVGTSGRVFPASFKTSPLLRAWLRRLDGLGVRLAARHRWTGFGADGALAFDTPEGRLDIRPSATLLALGGASWPRLGSDGGWVEILQQYGIEIAPLAPANCGFGVAWSAPMLRFEGAPLKRIALSFDGETVRGEAMITAEGIEGGAVYALSARLRAAVTAGQAATLLVDLRPDLAMEELSHRLHTARRGDSLSNVLRKKAGLPPVSIALLREATGNAPPSAPDPLARLIKALPLRLLRAEPIDRAISTAGGIAWSEVTDECELKRLPGIFVAGEMLDWDAPTGGYLLQACFATGVAAARAMLHR